MQNFRAVAPASTLHGTGAAVVHAYNPLDPTDKLLWRAKHGATLADVAPKTILPVVCSVNGEFVLKADWEVVELLEEDVAVFQQLPMGGDGQNAGSVQAVLGVILIAVGAYTGQGNLIAYGAGLLLSGLVSAQAQNVPLLGNNQTEAPSPTYNIQLAGNTARLGQAIPVTYGRHIINPDFAAQPYQEYDTADNQFYSALLCYGLMNEHTVESVLIDDTQLSHFVDYSQQFVGPQYGISVPTIVDPTVVTAPEVAGQELQYGVIVGPFASCGAGLQSTRLDIDIVCPKGLFFADSSGALTSKTVEFFFEARLITDNGAAAGAWFPLSSVVESLTLAQNSAVRRTFSYPVPQGRYEVRGQRTDVKDTNSRAAHDINWAGLKSVISVSVPLDSDANYLALRIKATNQLSGLSQRKIAIIVQRHLPSWDPVNGWAAPTATSSIAWALADVLRNPVYGPALPDSMIDLQTLYELDQVWSARKDEFNAVFDKRITVWQALTTIAACGRAKPIVRGSVVTFVRDELQTLPSALFTMRNIEKGSFQIEYKIADDNVPDGIELEYFDANTWSLKSIRMPVPGVSTSVDPAFMSMKGITNLYQAQRELAYMLQDMVSRTNTVRWTTEMEGYLPAYGDLVLLQHDLAGWGVSGEIEGWDGTEATCTEDLQWSVGNNYAVLVDEQGDVYGPFLVVPGTRPRSMLFADDIGMEPYTGTERERTRFSMGSGVQYAKQIRIVELTPSDDDRVSIVGVVENNAVHFADAPYPTPTGGTGGVGGSTRRVARYAPSGVPNYNAASDAQRNAYGFYSTATRTVGTSGDPGYVYSE